MPNPLNPARRPSFVVFCLSNRWVAVLIAVIFFTLAFLILFQQKVTFGLWFQIGDLHHETFAIAAVAFGLGVLVGSAITVTGKSHEIQHAPRR
jgi:hypothetical protein